MASTHLFSSVYAGTTRLAVAVLRRGRVPSSLHLQSSLTRHQSEKHELDLMEEAVCWPPPRA